MSTEILLSLAFGLIIGVTMGLTGGGGTIFGVPLLVYGLGTPPREAIHATLAAVALTAMIGVAQRWRDNTIDLVAGLIFAAGGMLGAQGGTWLGNHFDDTTIMTLFGVLMFAAATHLWVRAGREELEDAETVNMSTAAGCRLSQPEDPHYTPRCLIVLVVIGLITGVLTGLFGVGGGFIIVPALVAVTRMPVHRAVGTSLLVIAFVAMAGTVSHLAQGGYINYTLAGHYVGAGGYGMVLGSRWSRRLPEVAMQRLISGAILFVAVFTIWKNLG